MGVGRWGGGGGASGFCPYKKGCGISFSHAVGVAGLKSFEVVLTQELLRANFKD